MDIKRSHDVLRLQTRPSVAPADIKPLKGHHIKKHGYFSEHYAQEHDVPIDEIASFFKNEFRLCQVGEADLKEVIALYLPKWKWDESVDEFLDYWFTHETDIDENVLAEVKKFREQGIGCYLTTDQEKYRAEYLRELLEFNDRIDGCFFSCDLGFTKDQTEFFEKIIETLRTQPTGITYLDVDQKNVDVAEKLGINAKFYNDISVLRTLQ